jgi:hypothetical protein
VLNARLILVALICTSPAILLFDGPIVRGLVAAAAVSGMLTLLRTMRPGEAAFFVSIARPISFVIAVPAAWMLIQLLPLGVLAHPIWSSAREAVGHGIFGSISIDIGASVMALGQYLTVVVIAVWSGAVAVDRHRAEWILFSLLVATALIALMAVVIMLADSTTPGFAATGVRMRSVDCAAIGVVIAGAVAIRTLERYETRHASPDRSVRLLMLTFVACAAAMAICIAALMLDGTANVIIAAGYGAAGVAAMVLIRRLGSGPWGIVAIVLPAIALAVFLAASNPALGTKSFSVMFATHVPESLIGTAQRVLADTPLWGNGAGTFSSIAPIYSDIDETVPIIGPPTVAAATAIELGSPALWFVMVTTIVAIVVLFRAAMQRGRDSFYATAGASCLLTLLPLAFVNSGLLGMAEAIIGAATVGLAFAQSKSRTVHR